MGIARLQAGIKWTCTICEHVIPNGEGILVNKEPYCEVCGLKFLKGAEKISNKIKEIENKRRYLK